MEGNTIAHLNTSMEATLESNMICLYHAYRKLYQIQKKSVGMTEQKSGIYLDDTCTLTIPTKSTTNSFKCSSYNAHWDNNGKKVLD